MGSVNKVVLVGYLGADPDLKFTGTGKAVCNLRLATTETWKDKGGVRQEKTEWHRITVWGDQAENCAKYLAKGRLVYVEGKLQTRSYEKNGGTMYATDVVSERVVFLGGQGGGRSEGDSEEDQGRSQARDSRRGGGAPANASPPPASDDDIPF